ncbi:hypothetical protein [Acidimangrovimonas sediminis]|uniref:hypothetical protein n=1 Tax=Acidimangrovimonas sediminis TaxID=2056283 RepID=UPI0018EE03CF|nr:hypothetical protein [Acidimangrovimonas sediminis]
MAVALAMGAAEVVVPGRNGDVLEDLVRRYGSRLSPVMLGGDAEDDTIAMGAAAREDIDCVLDILPPTVPASVAPAALMAVRPYGRAVLMGGIGMLGGDDLQLPYAWLMRNCITLHGQWMYPQTAVPRLVALARSGQLDLGQWEATPFDLEHVILMTASRFAMPEIFRYKFS